MCLDHLNLRLADAEFSVDAFAAFRSSQLQPLRAFLLDPSSSLPHRVELSGREMTGERGREGAAAGELQDLILVGNEGEGERGRRREREREYTRVGLYQL